MYAFDFLEYSLLLTKILFIYVAIIQWFKFSYFGERQINCRLIIIFIFYYSKNEY
jgi:hypothetical protein